MNNFSRRRQGVKLSESLLHRLNSYAVGATAAGVGILCLARPAEAKIVYTPAHISITEGSYDEIRLGPTVGRSGNFLIDWQSGETASRVYVDMLNRTTSAIVETGGGFAGALRSGAPIGPDKRYSKARAADMGSCAHPTRGYSTRWDGPWANVGKGVKNRYLGLRFLIQGQIHYGWARLTVTTSNNRFATIVLEGYAYESIPNKPIRAGLKREQDVIEPASLGHLARGASAISK